MASDSDIIQVEILGTRLQLKGGDNPDEVREIAEFVRDQVHALSERAPTAPSLQLALLTAINIADELHRMHRQGSQEGQVIQAAVEKVQDIMAKTASV